MRLMGRCITAQMHEKSLKMAYLAQQVLFLLLKSNICCKNVAIFQNESKWISYNILRSLEHL